MSVGTYISGTGHAALVVWMVAGWGMNAAPLPMEVIEFTSVSGAEFAALTQGPRPDQPVGAIEAPEPPVVEESQPVAEPVEQSPPEVTPPPEPITPPVAETPPEAPDLTVPETVVTDAPPDVPDTPTIVPPPSAEIGNSLRPVPRPAPRVAPEIVEAPEPDATIAPEVTEAASEQVEAPVDEVAEPVEETTAPAAATDQIVTEAEEPSFAPQVSSRPASRPASVAAAAQAAEAAEGPAVDPVEVALAEAGAAETPTQTPTPGLSGGQLSEGDKSGFLRQIGACWNTGTLSTGAQNTIIDMAFDMTPDGRPVSASIRLDGFTGGNASDADAAFQTARRALLRCTGEGYDLPQEQYDQWSRVILTVDPTAMRQR